MLNISSTRADSEKIKSLAIGKFDGMHLAHKKLIENLGEDGAILCVKTNEAKMLTPQNHLYTSAPIFDLKLDDVKNFSGEEFARFLCENFQNLKRIIVGYDFKFGKNRAFCAADLQRFLPQMSVQIFDEIKIDGISAHSKNIRDFITDGDVRAANALLGRLYSVSGCVVRGQNLGSKQLYATINLDVDSENFNFLTPKAGVYATLARFGDDGRKFKSVSFVGNRISTDGKFSIETHILNECIVSAPQFLELFFVQKIRDNKAFENLECLKAQISKDIDNAAQILAGEN